MSYLSDDWVRSLIYQAVNIPLRTIISSGGTTTISASDLRIQITGTQNHTIRMYDATTVPQGRSLYVWNESVNPVEFINQSNQIIFHLEPQCVANVFLLDNTTPDGYWKDSIVFPIETSMFMFSEDWMSQTTAGETNWGVSNNGSGTSIALGSNPNAWGLVVLNNGTNTTNRAAIWNNVLGVTLGTGFCVIEQRIYIETPPSVTNDYKAWYGLGDQVSNTSEMTDGAYFYINRGVYGNVWVLGTSDNNTRTFLPTTIPVTVGWHTLKMEIYHAGNKAEYYVDGVKAGEITTNIPVGIDRVTGFAIKLVNNAVTATQIRTFIDYFKVRAYLNR